MSPVHPIQSFPSSPIGIFFFYPRHLRELHLPERREVGCSGRNLRNLLKGKTAEIEARSQRAGLIVITGRTACLMEHSEPVTGMGGLSALVCFSPDAHPLSLYARTNIVRCQLKPCLPPSGCFALFAWPLFNFPQVRSRLKTAPTPAAPGIRVQLNTAHGKTKKRMRQEARVMPLSKMRASAPASCVWRTNPPQKRGGSRKKLQ